MDIDTTTATPVETAAGRDLTGLAETLDALADRMVVAARTATTPHAVTAPVDGLVVAGGLAGAVDRITAAIVFLLGAADHADVIAARGLTAAAWLRAVAGRTGGDAGMLLAAADRLADMPAVAAWFADGTLSWGAVRGIVAGTRNLTADQRRWVDTALADDRDRITRLDGDEVVAAVDRLVNVARPDLARDRAARAFDRRYLALQPGLDGTGRIYGELDAETTAAALQAFDTTPTHDHHHGDGGGGDDDGWGRRQSNHDTFRAMCDQRRTRHRDSYDAADTDHGAAADGSTDTDSDAGDDPPADADTVDPAATGPDAAEPDAAENGGGAAGRGEPVADLYARHGGAPSAARPSMLIVADITALTGSDGGGVGSATAQLLWRTTRSPVELTPQAAQRLACDATLRAVLVDGAVPLGVGAAHPKVSATMRAALTVRDGGCRFTGCHAPADRCDAHHLIPIADGGPTRLENLALLCVAHHHAVHEGGWRATLHDDASMTFARRGTTITSLPRAHQQIRPATPPPPGRPTRATAGGRDNPGDRTPARPYRDTPAAGRDDPGDRTSPPRSGSPPPPLPF